MKCKIICAFLLLASATSYAQDTVKTLNEVIVTATKSPIKQSETGKVVDVITQEQLQKSAGKTLGEILNQQPGLIINGADNNLGTNQTVYMEGASSGNTLILLDGVPLYDASGITSEFDLNNFALGNIEKIEIEIGKIQPRLAEIETLLGDSVLYEANRKDDLLKLMNEQSTLKTKLESSEEKMLELMMELEELESSFE